MSKKQITLGKHTSLQRKSFNIVLKLTNLKIMINHLIKKL